MLVAQLLVGPGPTLAPRITAERYDARPEHFVSGAPITVQSCGIRKIIVGGLFGGAVGFIAGAFATGFFGPDRQGASVTPYVVIGALVGMTLGTIEAARNGCITRDPPTPALILERPSLHPLTPTATPINSGGYGRFSP